MGNPYVANAFAGIRVCVCVLIFNAVCKLLKKAVVDRKTAALYVVILAMALVIDASPVVFVLFAAAAGIVLHLLAGKGDAAV